jgi:hypothetical protein
MANEKYKDRNGCSWIIVDSSDGQQFFGTVDPDTGFTDGKLRYDPPPPDTSIRSVVAGGAAAVKAEIELFAGAHKGDVVLRVQAPGTAPSNAAWVWLVILAAIAYESSPRRR